MDRRRFVKLGSIGAALFAMNNSVFAQKNNSQPSIYGRNANIKPIMGSWFEFKHHLDSEGIYWNNTLAKFTDEQWKALVRDPETSYCFLLRHMVLILPALFNAGLPLLQ